jgi:anti-anti-sigma factor
VSCAAALTSWGVREGGTEVLAVLGELDLFTGPLLVSWAGDRIDRQPDRLVLDVAAVSFCDASGLAALVSAQAAAAEAGVRFALTGIRPSLRRLLTLAGLEAAFDVWSPHGVTTCRRESGAHARHGGMWGPASSS